MEQKIDGLCTEMKDLKALVRSLVPLVARPGTQQVDMQAEVSQQKSPTALTNSSSNATEKMNGKMANPEEDSSEPSSAQQRWLSHAVQEMVDAPSPASHEADAISGSRTVETVRAMEPAEIQEAHQTGNRSPHVLAAVRMLGGLCFGGADSPKMGAKRNTSVA